MAGKAKNGQGTIKPRTLADGTVVYDAWASVKDPITGKSSRPSKRGLLSETAAVEWIATQRASKTRRISGMTLDDLAEMLWASGSVKPTTLSYWKRGYKAEINPYLGGMAVTDILPMHIDAWVGKIRAKVTRGKLRQPNSLINHLTVLSAVLDYGVLNRFIDADWTKVSPAVRKLREDAANQEHEEKEIWTVQQFLDFLKFETEPSYRAMWCFMAATAVRRGAACGLLWTDVNFDRDLIILGDNRVPTPDGVMVSTPKGGKKQTIHMDETLKNILLKQQERQEKAKDEGDWDEHGVVFDRPVLRHSWKGEVFRPGRPMDPKSVTERFRRHARYADNPPASPHDLRHMWATLAKDSGASRETVGDQLGHKSTVVTRVYDHSTTAQKELAGSMAKTLLG